MEVKLDKMKAKEENASRLCLEKMNELENAKLAMEHKIIELGQLYAKPVWNINLTVQRIKFKCVKWGWTLDVETPLCAYITISPMQN